MIRDVTMLEPITNEQFESLEVGQVVIRISNHKENTPIGTELVVREKCHSDIVGTYYDLRFVETSDYRSPDNYRILTESFLYCYALKPISEGEDFIRALY